ncbi:MAG: hypothetical protein LBR40_00730 [Bacilli bacterium]|jgi:dsDNA-specific endonuclease/ATPase MutS2|nr:hypothetical protein [Bacilli bacterium]
MDAFLNKKQREEVGFTYVINELKIKSSYGKDYLSNLKPFKNEELLKEEFNRIAEVKEIIINYPKPFNEIDVYLARLKNISSIINNLDYVILDEIEIFEVKKLIYNIININHSFKVINKIPNYLVLADYSELFAYLDLDNSKQPFFSIYNDYHPELKTKREQLKQLSKEDEYYQYLTNEIKEIEKEVKVEISKKIADYQTKLLDTINQLGYIDLLIAKSYLAITYQLNSPSISNEIILTKAYNPMIKEIVNKKEKNYIPLDIVIDKKINIITGSNMAGKSVTLKNIILNVCLFQYGFYPFVLNAKLPILDYIIYISDELQDVSNSLSSFGKEIVVLNEALSYIENKNGLFVLDELARGTNPVEAKMIVKGVCQYLQELNIKTILATHLDLDLDIDFAHYQVVGLSNYQESELNDDIDKIMDYSLIKVNNKQKVPNDAFKVMKLLKMNDKLRKIIEKEYERR